MVDLQDYDLTPYHTIASFGGILLATWLIVLSKRDRFGLEDKMCFRWSARISYALIGGAMGWSAMFAFNQAWQPWPPHLLLCLVVDIKMVTSILAVYFRHKVK